jgi:hypothetical protein
VKIKTVVNTKAIVYDDYEADEDEKPILTNRKKKEKLVSKKLISYIVCKKKFYICIIFIE